MLSPLLFPHLLAAPAFKQHVQERVVTGCS